ATDADARALVPVCGLGLSGRRGSGGHAARSREAPVTVHDAYWGGTGLAASALERAQGGGRRAAHATAPHRRHVVSQAGCDRRPRRGGPARLRLSRRATIGRTAAGAA